MDDNDKLRSQPLARFLRRLQVHPRRAVVLLLLGFAAFITLIVGDFPLTRDSVHVVVAKAKAVRHGTGSSLITHKQIEELAAQSAQLLERVNALADTVQTAVDTLHEHRRQLLEEQQEALKEVEKSYTEKLDKLSKETAARVDGFQKASTESFDNLKKMIARSGRQVQAQVAQPVEYLQQVQNQQAVQAQNAAFDPNGGGGAAEFGGGEFSPAPPDQPLSDPEAENTRRREAVKDAFIHSWNGYKAFAWGHDELQPLSRRGKDWMKGQQTSGVGLTILDSLASLWLLDLKEEFDLCLAWIRESLDFDKDIDASAFESTIRMLAGLLSAYELSGEQHRFLIDKAVDLADRLLWAYNTSTGIPHATVNYMRHTHSNPKWTAGASILSEFGTVQLEFRTLTHHTGNKVYDKKVTRIMDIIRRHMPPDGLPPTYFHASSGHWASDHVTLGALGDSYYEYLLKQYLLTGKKEEKYRQMFEQAAKGIIERLVKSSQPSGQMYISEWKRGTTFHKMDHLACFAGGMFALASVEIQSDASSKWMDIAKGVTETCHQMYSTTRTGISPEVAEFRGGGDLSPGAPYYILRPETVEAYFYLWRFTRDQKYRDYGWQMFLAVNRWCRVPSGGFSGIKNVNVIPPQKDDLMQSFWLAETLKYLYLLFADDSALDLSQWVFTTEAHPLKIRPKSHTIEADNVESDYESVQHGAVQSSGVAQDDYAQVQAVQQQQQQQAARPVPPGYRMLRSTDAEGHDLPGPHPAHDIPLLADLCNADPRCKGFNSNGWLKGDVSRTRHHGGVDLYLKL